MSDITIEERILEAIESLRRRKARPNANRICNFLLRRFLIDDAVTREALDRLLNTNPPKIIRVTYKGQISFRVPNKLTDTMSRILSSALSEITVTRSEYIEFGVPPDQLEKFLIEKLLFKKKNIDTLIEKEIVKSNFKRLETGNLTFVNKNNYALKEAMELKPTPLSGFHSDEIVDKVQDEQSVGMVSSKSSESHQSDVSDEDMDTSNVSKSSEETKQKIKPHSKLLATEKKLKREREKLKTSFAQAEWDIENPGVRRKRAVKKVFDPWDNVKITKRGRGRPAGSKNKEPIKADKDRVEQVLNGICYMCNRLDKEEKLIACRDCTTKVHPSCTRPRNESSRSTPWQCSHCKTCCVCSETDEYAAMVVCRLCDEGYHFSCHTPQVTDTINDNWTCCKCFLEAKERVIKRTHEAALGSSSSESPDIKDIPSPQLPLPSPPTISSSGVSSGIEENMDETVPDASLWTVDEVSEYLRNEGYPQQAKVFKANEIDGASLLLMKRSDVLGNMDMKLGPALKAYKQVKKLQIRRTEAHLLWA